LKRCAICGTTAKKDAVVLSHRYDKKLLGGDVHPEKFYVYSAFGERQMVSEGFQNGVGQVPPEERLSRRADIARFYTTANADSARGLLRRYGVTHVIVEKDEALPFATDGLLEPFYKNEWLTIFRVAESAGKPA
jgi:hypothetical protein